MQVGAAIPDASTLYRALVSRDARFDGAVFYGITSTGIYCRPVCPARTPRIQNCRFFTTAAAAQQAGFRPCLRCRPETAPGRAAWHGTANSVSRALQLIQEGALDSGSVEDLAARVGLGDRQLRRLFLHHLGVAPVAVAQTRRLLFAKQLLHDTSLPIPAVAEAAGFGSERRLHEAFQQVFQRPPLSIRRAATTDAVNASQRITLRLRYRAPYHWDSMLHSLRTGADAGVEFVSSREYQRTLQAGKSRGQVSVTHDPKRTSLLVAVQWHVLRDLPVILASVRRLFDTDADIHSIERILSTDRMLAPLIRERPGVRVAGSWNLQDEAESLLHNPLAANATILLPLARKLDKTITSQARLQTRSEAWRPWQAYAAQHLLLSQGETQ